jgi:hypothetical protein
MITHLASFYLLLPVQPKSRRAQPA